MNILVTGGAGYIGSVVVEECIAAGHNTIALDDLSKGHRESVHTDAHFVECNIADIDAVTKAFNEYKIDAVIHMAASSLVGESVIDPSAYYGNNLVAGLSLLRVMVDTGIAKLVFSSTAAVYGNAVTQPIQENDVLSPTNPYGETKLAFERALGWYEAAYGIRSVSLRYFNAAGATERCGEMHEPESHLIPIVLQAAAGLRPAVDVYGTDYPTPDGTCIRDYIHVSDLARAHVLAIGLLENRSAVFNLGCGGDGYSVNEVIEAAERITGRKILRNSSERRAGDPAVLIASSDKIRTELGWVPQYQNLDTIIESAWLWMENRRVQSRHVAA
jgi:UDP-glucose 4-epimerase